ncbi:citrate synthase [Rhizobium lentis]|uniref:citrate synthase n=1 Tax=Rhizobium lentis TaxID=1138194 RepID=UPI001C829BC3|nr:citrate synthase [Rhizobium lentis]MBX4984350.1 citrate synthase [Rhizobium lentis]MBX5002671.1 citrate synthase [Rhizobium lentis]MBX5027547.1 citrate synthase [Rhizobium lentis]MBX5033378.1 citrate synthase [Rhizobium lentis]MBX5045443.1 citrate synthase [Rhizobium lentis]
MSWLTAEEALRALKTKPQTLYANVSRGRIRAKPDPADPRRSLYQTADVQRLAERHAGRRKAETVAAEAIRWGDPVLSSAISIITGGRLSYRGRDAADLAEEATLEQTAALLWNSVETLCSGSGSGKDPPSLQAAFLALAGRVTSDLPSLGRSQAALRREAHGVLSSLAAALAAGPSDELLHLRLAASWGRPDAADCLRRALVLLADHELNASTFAARVTASAGASLSAAVLSGLATLTGPLHGAAWQGVEALTEAASALGAEQAIRRTLAQGNHLAAFGHPLYPDGDIRAQALLSQFSLPSPFAEVRAVGEEIVGEKVNVDFALAAMAAAFDLPKEAPIIVFSLSRCTGWLAHAMEQIESGELIRPRARYAGPAPAPIPKTGA